MGSEGGHLLVGDEGEAAAAEHAAGETTEDWAHLCVQITKHFVEAPAADEADDVGIDTGTEESIGARGAKASRSNILGQESRGGAEETNC